MKRRQLLQSTLAFGTLPSVALAAPAVVADKPKADMSTDVVIVGGGFAGLTAAVTAARAGAKVVVDALYVGNSVASLVHAAEPDSITLGRERRQKVVANPVHGKRARHGGKIVRGKQGGIICFGKCRIRDVALAIGKGPFHCLCQNMVEGGCPLAELFRIEAVEDAKDLQGGEPLTVGRKVAGNTVPVRRAQRLHEKGPLAGKIPVGQKTANIGQTLHKSLCKAPLIEDTWPLIGKQGKGFGKLRLAQCLHGPEGPAIGIEDLRESLEPLQIVATSVINLCVFRNPVG